VAEVGTDGWVTRLIEKPTTIDNNLAVVGCYYFEHSEDLISAIEQQMARNAQLKGEFFLVDAINIMLERGLRMRTRSVRIWQDCGKPESLLETNAYLLDHGRDNSDAAAKREGVVIVPPVFVDPSADVSESVIGPHVSIGPECFIRRSVLRNSIVDASSHIVDTTLSASLIGREARVIGRDRTLNVGDSSEVGLS
jgi:glucose-1-phosphate thymidylyltransferase